MSRTPNPNAQSVPANHAQVSLSVTRLDKGRIMDTDSNAFVDELHAMIIKRNMMSLSRCQLVDGPSSHLVPAGGDA